MAMQVDVPDVDGVPDVLYAAGSGQSITLASSDAAGVPPFTANYGPQWGIFLGGELIVTADTVTAFEFKNESVISDFPVEEGSFESYDKVARPFLVRCRFASGGSESNKTALLSSVAAISGDLNLYDAMMPEATFTSCNVVGYNFARTAQNGLGLLQVDVMLEQVIVVGGDAMSNTMSPSGADQVNGGTVQPVTPPTQTQADIDSGYT